MTRMLTASGLGGDEAGLSEQQLVAGRITMTEIRDMEPFFLSFEMDTNLAKAVAFKRCVSKNTHDTALHCTLIIIALSFL